MNRRDRLMATLRGDPVDRPAVNFYELNGLEDPADSNPFNIFSHPSWQPLIELAREKTDRIVMQNVPCTGEPGQPVYKFAQWETRYDEEGSRLVTCSLKAGGRALTLRTRQDRDVNTVWTIEHLLKDVDDLKAVLDLPETAWTGQPDTRQVLEVERQLGDSGIVMLDTPDPLCWAADLFDMGQYTVVAMTEPELFHRMLERLSRNLLPRVEAIARALPGRLWRIYGPEYATPPYLPPSLFKEYVVRYDKPMVEAIQRHGGFARLHSHGRIQHVLDSIVSTGCSALDPIEPPPQGDVSLTYVREKYGDQLALFGNLEISDIENLPVREFEKKVVQALREGTAGNGRGFVLMPSSSPYGRLLSPQTLENYRRMVELAESG